MICKDPSEMENEEPDAVHKVKKQNKQKTQNKKQTKNPQLQLPKHLQHRNK